MNNKFSEGSNTVSLATPSITGNDAGQKEDNMKNRAISTTLLIISLVAISLPADARVRGPRLDSVSAGCGALQDESDQLRAEYARQSTSNARREDILTRLRQIGSAWNDICRSSFGDMSIRVAPLNSFGKTGKMPQFRKIN